jgi:hypothetical protein
LFVVRCAQVAAQMRSFQLVDESGHGALQGQNWACPIRSQARKPTVLALVSASGLRLRA